MAAASAQASAPKGTLFVVATPIGNLEDITLRALRVLREVSVIASEDTRHTARLLARHAIATPTTSLHEHNEHAKSPAIVARLQRGDDVALVSDAGTPTVSDPGARLIRDAIRAGIRVTPIPGPSAILSALVVSGLPTDGFTFLGFPPIRAKDRKVWFARLAAAGGTVVFFEAPHRIQRTLTDLRAAIGNRLIVVGRELTKAHEELVRGPIDDVLSASIKPRGEFTVVADIGEMTKSRGQPVPDATSLLLEFGELANNGRLSRRQAVTTLARKHGVAPNDVYRMLEEAKNLASDQVDANSNGRQGGSP